MKTKSIFLFILCLGLALSPGAFADATPPVRVGVLLPLSGAFSRYGLQVKEAVSKYQSDKVKFIFEDEGCNAQKGVSAYRKLSSFDGINIFLGPWCGSPQSAIAPALKTKKQLALLSSSAPEEVYALSGQKMLSTQPSIELESTFLAEKMNEAGVKNVAVIFKENTFSRAHEAAFRKTFKGKVFDTLTYDTDEVSYLRSIALKVKELNPDALYVPDAFPILQGFLKELKNIGYEKLVYSVYSVQSKEVLRVAGADSDKLIYSYYDIGENDAFDHFPDVAAKILTTAINGCGADVECIDKELRAKNSFNTHGTLDGGLILKRVKDGKFVKIR